MQAILFLTLRTMFYSPLSLFNFISLLIFFIHLLHLHLLLLIYSIYFPSTNTSTS